MSYQVVIAAGGAGLRMRDLLGETPKILAPIDGKPFITLVLEQWRQMGCEHVHLLLGYRSAEIWESCKAWLETVPADQQRLKLSATIEPEPLGVGGALNFARGCLKKQFVLTYGDVYPTVNIDALLDKMAPENTGCIAVCPADIAQEPPNILIEGGRVKAYSKERKGMTHVDVGAILLTSDLLKSTFVQNKNEEHLLSAAIEAGTVAAYQHPCSSKHIGDPRAYQNFVDWFCNKK